jgi:hypothetical protein
VRFTHFLFQYYFTAPLLAKALASANEGGRRANARLLAAMGRVAIPSLLAQLGSKDATVRELVIRTINEMVLTGRRLVRTPEEVSRSLQDPSLRVRVAAAVLLGWIGDEVALDPLIGSLSDGDFLVRARAARSLGAIGSRRATPPADRAAPSHGSPRGHLLRRRGPGSSQGPLRNPAPAQAASLPRLSQSSRGSVLCPAPILPRQVVREASRARAARGTLDGPRGGGPRDRQHRR